MQTAQTRVNVAHSRSLVLLVIAFSAGLHAQGGGAPAPPVFRTDVNSLGEPIRVDVNLVEVDATVRDSQNNYRDDLRREDFEIREDGKPRAISHFSFERLPKTIAILVDNCDSLGIPANMYGIPDDMSRLLNQFIERYVGERDRLAIVPCQEGSSVLNRLTREPEALRKASNLAYINTPTWFPDYSYWWSTRYVPEPGKGGARYGVGPYGEQPLMYGPGSFEAIRSTVEGLSTLPGRKELVVISSSIGWSRYPADGAVLRDLSEKMNRAGIVLYVIDPGDELPYSSTTDIVAPGAVPRIFSPDYRRVIFEFSWIPFRDRSSLDSVADATGGFAVHFGGVDVSGTAQQIFLREREYKRNMLDFVRDSLDRAGREGSGYYLLGYTPEEPGGAPNTFHRLDVRVLPPGLKVAARRGYYAHAVSTSARTESTADKTLQAESRSTLHGGDLPFRLRVFDFAGPRDARTGVRSTTARALVVIDARQLSPVGSARRVAVELHAEAFGGGLEPVGVRSSVCSAPLPAGDLSRRRLVCAIDLTIPEPGAYTVRVAIRDQGSGRTGSAWSLQQMLNYGAHPGVSQLTVARAEMATEPIATDANPVDQVFEPGDKVGCSVEVYMPLDRKRAPRLSGRFALLRYAIDPEVITPQLVQIREWVTATGLTEVVAPPEKDIAIVNGVFPLPSDLPPGEYELLYVLYDLSTISEKDAKSDLERRLAEAYGLSASRPGRPYPFLATASITVVPPGGPAPPRIYDPMGSVRPLTNVVHIKRR